MKKIGFVFSHVHWDIEWYLPYRSFRFWLVKYLDRLIDPVAKQKGFKTFVLDGQVAPVDHYLEVKPENAGALRRLVRSGKLSVGPFYTQFDEWLTGPEAMVRNALYGDRRARALGRVMKAGHLPDNFGHPPQMPQILAGFDLNSLVFMRGMPERSDAIGDQFFWVGLDGTRILGVHLRNTYCQAHALGTTSSFNPWWPPQFRSAPFGEFIQTPEFLHHAARETDLDKGAQALTAAARTAEPGCHSGVIPIPNGYDSACPQETIAAVIERANQVQNEYRFVQGNVEQLTQAILKSGVSLPDYTGDLWGGKYQLLLTGANTTRSYLKQANFIGEALLERYAEPLSALAALNGAPWPARLLEEAWRWLFLNEAHDGIHGSSADSAHEEMVQRFNAAKQIAVGLAHEALAVLSARMDDHRPGGLILAFNPAGGSVRTPVIDTWLHGFDAEKQCVVDAQGRVVPLQVVANPWAADTATNTASWVPPWPDGNPTHVLMTTPIPPGGISSLRITEGPASRIPSMGRQTQTSIENEHLRVRFIRGALDIFDKATGHTYRGLNTIEDEADRGDAWDFSPPWIDQPVLSSTAFPSTCRLVESGPVRALLEITTRMKIPRQLDGERRSRETVPLVLISRVALYRDARRVDVALDFDNPARDHRLRLKCPTGLAAETVLSQGHFGILEKPIRNPDEGKSGWSQPPPTTFHFREWVAVRNKREGLAIAARGLYEYESRSARSGIDLYLTLLRGFGRLGRANLKTRTPSTSPSLPTPGAQCLGPQSFQYAFIPYSPVPRSRAPFMAEALSFLYPPMAHQADPTHILVDRSLLAKGRQTAIKAPVFRIHPANVQVSAFKRAAEEDGWILRFWENEGRATPVRIELDRIFRRCIETNLNEDPKRPIPIRRNVLQVSVAPYKILTLKLFAT
jgi:mannosylglycerate hydrolase